MEFKYFERYLMVLTLLASCCLDFVLYECGAESHTGLR